MTSSEVIGIKRHLEIVGQQDRIIQSQDALIKKLQSEVASLRSLEGQDSYSTSRVLREFFQLLKDHSNDE